MSESTHMGDTTVCTCAHPTNDCPQHGTGCHGKRYMEVKAECARLRDALRGVVGEGPPLDLWANQDAAQAVRDALDA